MQRLAVSLALVGVAVATSWISSPAAHAVEATNQSFLGVAVAGTDVVAYHTEGRPVDGSSAHSHTWQGATWHFERRRLPRA